MLWADAAEKFTQALASPEPTPGGGAAAATAGAMGCALVQMAVATTLKRKATPVDFLPALERSLHQLAALQDTLHYLARQDAHAYAAYIAAYKLPKEDTSRPQAVQTALWGAALVPADTAEACRRALQESQEIADKIAPVILSDVLCGQHLLHAAAACCMENIRINLKQITVSERVEKLKKIVEAYESNGK